MFQGFSSAFWFGHGLIYQEMGILRQSAFDHACLRRICLDRQGCEKQTRSGSIFSETTDMALERARGYRICTGKQHLFTKLQSGYWRLGICSHRFPLVILHEGHPCPKLQNPLFQKAKENLLPGEKVPVRADEGGEKDLPFRSVWLRDDLFMMEPWNHSSSGLCFVHPTSQCQGRLFNPASA